MYYSHCDLWCVKGGFLALVGEPLGEDFLLHFGYGYTAEDASERFPDCWLSSAPLDVDSTAYCIPS